MGDGYRTESRRGVLLVGVVAAGLAAMLAAAVGAAPKSPVPKQPAPNHPAHPVERKPVRDPLLQDYVSPVDTTIDFARKLGAIADKNTAVSPAALFKRAKKEPLARIETLPNPAVKLPPEEIYLRAKKGVVMVGGVYKCDKCNDWHIECAGGFILRADGVFATNYHVIEAFKQRAALGIMTSDGRVFPVKSVLAASRDNDIAVLQADAQGLTPLPVAADAAVGGAVYCLSHPVVDSRSTINCPFTFTQGIVCGKFFFDLEKGKTRKVMAITADYAKGASGGPILNDRGAVVGMVCQAISVWYAEKGDVQMVWKFALPSCGLLKILEAPKPSPSPAGRG